MTDRTHTAVTFGIVSLVAVLVFLLWTLILGCGNQNFGGRREAGPFPSESAADSTAAVLVAPLDQQGMINAAVQCAVEAAFAKYGNAGRDINTFDSWTTRLAVGGLAASLWYSLRQKQRSQLLEQAGQRIVRELEQARVGEPCDCGHCADCVVDKLRLHGDTVECQIRRMVKSAGG